MKDVYMYLLIIGYFVGIILCILGFLGIRKLEKEHKKISNDELLLESEKPIQKRNIRFVISGLLINIATTIISFIVQLL